MEKTSQVYKKLYHYTTLEGAYGILKSQSLWGTHYKFLNDRSEIILFKDKLIEFLHPYIFKEYEKLMKNSPSVERLFFEAGGLEKVVQHDAIGLVEANYGGLGDEIYITSFCGEQKEQYLNENGLLGQWRAYGHGGGVALVFDTCALEEMLGVEAQRFSYGGGFLGDVVYSDDEEKLKAELTAPLSEIAEYAKKILTQVRLGGEEAPEAGSAMLSFIQCIARYKHRSFKEEHEVRLISLPGSHSPDYFEVVQETAGTIMPEKKRKFRDRNGEKVPYIELFGFDGRPLPIERVIIGPHKEKDQRAAALRTFLRGTNIDVVASDIPYVG